MRENVLTATQKLLDIWRLIRMSCEGPESASREVLIKEHKYSMMVSELLREAARYISEHSSELVQDVKYLSDVRVTIEIPCATDMVAFPIIKVESTIMPLEPEKFIDIYIKDERKGDL